MGGQDRRRRAIGSWDVEQKRITGESSERNEGVKTDVWPFAESHEPGSFRAEPVNRSIKISSSSPLTASESGRQLRGASGSPTMRCCGVIPGYQM